MSLRSCLNHALSCLVLAMTFAQSAPAESSFKTPVSYAEADRRAGALLAQMTLAQKLQLISGHHSFYVKGFPELGIPELYMSDATQGVHLRRELSGGLEQSTAFPCPLALTATWNPALAYRYAHSVGEECRAGGIAFLLGPGLNLYRISQNGRNFEYFGEDPYLASRLIERYVRGVLDTGTVPTLKHFLANNTDFHRRTSNSVIDERTLHELYLPAFQAGIAAGAMAVMTAYNQFNGEWCGQSRAVITDLLRGELGYRWLVMTDWWSVWDAEKIIRSGQDLEMPGEKHLKADAGRLLQAGRVTEAETDRMARSILRTCIAAGLHDRPARDDRFLRKFPEHEQVALQTAREAIVLLKNDAGLLPLRRDTPDKILLTGLYVEQLAHGGGSAAVEGYNAVSLRQALQDTYGDRLEYVPQPTDEQLRSATVVLLSTGTFDHEGCDRPFALPEGEEQRVAHTVALNPHTVVLVNSGGGIRMTDWNDRAAAILYAWYPGQIGNRALAEVLCGDTNPSGKLPITIERRFADSPGADYLPPGAQFYTGWEPDNDMSHPVYDIHYQEGVFVGYRWYEARKIAPLYPFGHGLSYTSFAYKNLKTSPGTLSHEAHVTVTFTVTNTGQVAGAEIAQLYVRDPKPAVPRPEKELKGFSKFTLQPGESHTVSLRLSAKDFAYWDGPAHGWKTEPHDYAILVGRASDAIELAGTVTLQ